MPNRRKLAFIAASIAVCWIAWAALVGIFAAVAHFLKSTTAFITVFLAVIYSCLFGLLGWQAYKLKGRPDGWPSANTRQRHQRRLHDTRKQDTDESGWKRLSIPKERHRE